LNLCDKWLTREILISIKGLMMKQMAWIIIMGGFLLIGSGSIRAVEVKITTETEMKDGNFVKGIFEQLLNKDFTGVMLGTPKFTSDLEGSQEVNDTLEVNWNGGCEPPGCVAQGEKGQVVQQGYNFGSGSTELAVIKFEDADTGTTAPLHISDQLALWQDFVLNGPTHYAMTFTSDCDSPCELAAPPPPSSTSVPEPSTLALIMAGLAGCTWRQRKKTTIILPRLRQYLAPSCNTGLQLPYSFIRRFSSYRSL
jgi:hypothetical protein